MFRPPVWLQRLWASLRGAGSEAGMSEELAHHRAMIEAEHRAGGMDAGSARRAAAMGLGGSDQITEAIRDQRSWPALDDLRRDLRLGWRSLRRSPGFTLVVVLSLALGIGANAAIFSLLDAALLRQLPVRAPNQLALLYWSAPKWPPALNQSGAGGPNGPGVGSLSLAYPFYEQLRDHGGGVLSSVFGFAPLSLGGPTVALMVHNQTTLVRAEIVTGQFFSGLGVGAARGRTITNADERSGAPLAAVMSYGYWTRQFSRDPGVVGAQVMLDGSPATIVGVAPPGFQGVELGQAFDVWLAISPTMPASLAPWGYLPPDKSLYRATDYWWLQVMARLRPGVSRARATAELGAMFHTFTAAGLSPEPKTDEMPVLGMMPGGQGIDRFGSQNTQALWILMAVVGLLLLLACANVAALLLARATARRREIGVRLALGAGRGRLIRQLLTESVLLAGLGGGLGLLLAPLGTRVLLALLGGRTGIPIQTGLDGHLVAFTASVSILTGILFGLAPAFRSTRIEIASVMKTGGSQAGDRTRLRGDKALAVTQVALSLVLLVGAGLFLRTLNDLQRQPLGFTPDHLLLFGLNGNQSGYHGADLMALYRTVGERVAAVPGVQSVTASRLALLTGWISTGPIHAPGVKLSRTDAQVQNNDVGPRFLATMGMDLRLGRDFTDADLVSSHKVAIINQTLASHVFGNANPIGRLIGEGDGTGANAEQGLYEIVGVSADARYGGLRGAMPPTFYIPYTQSSYPITNLTFEVRLAGNEQTVMPGIRRAIHGLDPALAISAVRMQDETIGDQLTRQRLFAELSTFFGLLGLLLACIGIEGTMAYAVARRTGEIGIRMALGASRGQVLWAVVRETLAMAAIGVAIGLGIALAAARLIASQLYGVKPSDSLTLAGAAMLMLGVAAVAGFLPARRAAGVDPMLALRAE